MEFWIVAALAAFILGLSKGGMPLIAILSVPLLSLFMDPALAAGLLLPLYILADAYAVYLFRHAFSVENLKILLPASVIGVVGGYFTVAEVSVDLTKLLLAVIGFSYLANSMRNRLSKREVPPKPAGKLRGTLWGATSGLTSYIAHAGGPPYQAYILPQRLEKMTYIGTTTIFFTTVNLMKLPPYMLAGQVTFESVSQSVWLIPAALSGAWSGAQISRLLPERIFFLLVELALAAVSFKLFSDVILSIF